MRVPRPMLLGAAWSTLSCAGLLCLAPAAHAGTPSRPRVLAPATVHITAADQVRVTRYAGLLRHIRRCESSGNYRINTGNGYYGAYQFAAATWRGLGYNGLPSQAPPNVQDAAAAKLLSRSGTAPWGVCG